jgi:hypothetical protein
MATTGSCANCPDGAAAERYNSTIVKTNVAFEADATVTTTTKKNINK